MRGRLADLDRLDAVLLAEWSAVLGELKTGHYRALLLAGVGGGGGADGGLEGLEEVAAAYGRRD
ncbi:hypothetical protein ACIGW7_11720 [Streptomyces sp. NPDC053253]|uniref:hypothetical protein n=1 Tax=Streptomyces sp. NPDC053253 TaxID=3365699 RepID=UPI0037D4E5C4